MNTDKVEVRLDMITSMLQKLGEEIKGKLNTTKEEWSEVQNQIQELKKETEIIKIQVDELKKGEENENKFDTYNRVRELFAKVLQIDINNIKIDDINWIGKRKKNRPMIIKFTNSIIKWYIVTKTVNMRNFATPLNDVAFC